jgi:hypothetical protein
MVASTLAVLAALVAPVSSSHPIITRGIVGKHRQTKLLQSWTKELDSSKGTPVTRVVNLLKEMQNTLKTEMEEDEALYEKMECWCNTGKYEKSEAIDAGKAKIDQLTAANEEGFARSKELKEQIADLEASVAADKAALKTAQAKRDEEVETFQGLETDSIQAIENMKSAIEVLGRHAGAAFPQTDAVSLLQTDPLSEHRSERSLETWMQESGNVGVSDSAVVDKQASKFLQSDDSKPRAAPSTMGWSADDMRIVRKALQVGKSFVQSKEGYYPSYESQSGAILGVLKQMKEQMEADYKAASEKEQVSAAAFADMRTAKTAAIEAGEAMAEQKEDELAKTDNLVAEAKEDLGQTEETLAADEEFLKNLDKMCADSDSAFEKRKASRLEEIKAVSETIEILTGDEARDAMSGTYNFLQVEASDKNRKAAAAVLRKVGLKTHNIDISFLANKVELDAFTKVKKAIDDMVTTLKQEQADEVKKNDYCTQELQSTEMTIAKADDLSADLQAKIGSLEAQENTLSDEIEADKAAIAQGQMDLQRASEDRQRENLDFQKTIADQTMTIEILMKAMERLAQFYDAQLLQVHAKKQTPPVEQMEYKPNAGASGIMSMIEKLIYDAKDLVAASKKAEMEAQTAYEQLTADTNQSQADLAQAVVEKTKAKAKAHKEKLGAESDLMDNVDELEGLHKYETDVHEECDYLLKNFMARQQARGEEIEGLQQAKQILDGANLR